jgi:hypothetical protein
MLASKVAIDLCFFYPANASGDRIHLEGQRNLESAQEYLPGKLDCSGKSWPGLEI